MDHMQGVKFLGHNNRVIFERDGCQKIIFIVAVKVGV